MMNGITFNDPRLKMTIGGRFLVRVVSYVAYLFLFAATFTLLISTSARLQFLGLFFLLVIIDLAVHRREGDVPIAELPIANGKLPAMPVNAAKAMLPTSFSIIERAFDRALMAHHDFYPEVAGRLADLPEIGEGLRRLDADPKEFREKAEEMMEEGGKLPASDVHRSPDAVRRQAEAIAIAAFEVAVQGGHNFVKPSDLFSALLQVRDETIDRLFNFFNIEQGDLERALILSSAAARARKRLPDALGGFRFETHRTVRHRIMNRAWTSRPTPVLDRYGDDLTDLARGAEIGFLIGHEQEYEKLVETLGRPVNPNALLVGEPGIGKETLVQHLAAQLTKDRVPRALFDKRLVSLRLQDLVAGATPDELHLRLKRIVDEIRMAGNVIIYIPDIHNLVRTSGTAFMSAADALMPVIMDNVFPIVGTTYPREFKQLMEPRSDFLGAFEVIPVDEVSPADAEKILAYGSLLLEHESRIVVSFGAIKRAVVLAKKYFHDRFLPSSAEELLKAALISAEQRGEKTLGPDRVTAVAEAKTHIPLHEAAGAEAERLLHMEDVIHERLIGQDEAVRAVSQALREYRSGLARAGGPIASFLFVGPTGVGKTELAKTLAKIQFGSEKMMVRFDMTEYQDKQSFFRFIGSPDGQTDGALTEAVRAKPYSLILLDEFEKAHPDILNLFLQVFDDGRLTDNLSRTVDFTNTIIIATSNAHSDIINEALGKGETMEQIGEYLKARLTDVFKPELLNRFSKIIVFRNLKPDELGKIVVLNLDELAETVKGQGIYLEYDPAAVQLLAKLGYDPAFGARPLRRVIEEKIRAPLAEAILARKVEKGRKLKLVVREPDDFDFVSA
ncbi:MAG: ATP-dependent Clp protease ATP-binding subunit [Patescibacteria group bacterium]|nr:ATP-dependent Clp protease ATP-binding subunit [Patescibacteria group bacterium]